MFTRSKVSVAALIALGGLVSLAHAQSDTEKSQLERVTVTGSAIKSIAAETAVPVTVVKMKDLKAEGITTVEQILGTLTASQSSLGTSQAVGSATGGASFADLRGIGANKTLVLLNGRRIANNAFDGSAPDLNMIPIAALERVEVLRDGASSLYGTDAIGGVINFITRQDYQGGTITLGADAPQHAGGKSKNASAGFGFGDIDKNGYNLFGFIDLQKQGSISGTQRPYNTIVPSGLSSNVIPASYFQIDPSLNGPIGNPAAPDCTSGDNMIQAGTYCRMATSSYVDYLPKTSRVSGMLKQTLKLNDDHRLGLEYFVSQSHVKTTVAPVPYGYMVQNPYLPDGVTPNPYYPGNSGSGFNPSFALDPNFQGDASNGNLVGQTLTADGNKVQPGYLFVNWRDTPNGPRRDDNVNTQQRVVLSLDGTMAGWDYNGAVTFNQNRVSDNLIGGYTNGDIIQDGILDGVINPFGAQSDAGKKLLASAFNAGTLMSGTARTTGIDFHASRELGDWFHATRPVALAIGAEHNSQKFITAANSAYAATVEASTGVDANTYNAGKRNVTGVFAELQVPVLKNLDVTLAVRHDRYSDFGGTTNPKVSFIYTPVKELRVRGSYSTGFRAPSLYELNAAQAYTNTSTVSDPVVCPQGGDTGAGCSEQFMALTGGNTLLKPEKSKTGNFGLVYQPTRDLNVGVDFWWLQLRDQIQAPAYSALFDVNNLGTFGSLYHRNAGGTLSTNGTQCPGDNCGFVDARYQNLGGVVTDGLDISGQYALRTAFGGFTFRLNSTFVNKYVYQSYQGGPWLNNVDQFSNDKNVFRWQHTLNVNWAMGDYSLGLVGHYKTGYADAVPSKSYSARDVSSYTTFDLYGSWRVIKPLSLTLGVRNLLDRDPPFSQQTTVFQAGYDPRYADAIGRTFYVRGTYDF
jgi:iron complex outermembrane receptor protein